MLILYPILFGASLAIPISKAALAATLLSSATLPSSSSSFMLPSPQRVPGVSLDSTMEPIFEPSIFEQEKARSTEWMEKEVFKMRGIEDAKFIDVNYESIVDEYFAGLSDDEKPDLLDQKRKIIPGDSLLFESIKNSFTSLMSSGDEGFTDFFETFESFTEEFYNKNRLSMGEKGKKMSAEKFKATIWQKVEKDLAASGKEDEGVEGGVAELMMRSMVVHCLTSLKS
jgi:hypothetical protein